MKKVIAIIIICIVNICFTSSFSMAELVYSEEKAIDDGSIIFMINNPYASISGKFHLLDPENTGVKPVNINGRTLIPLRFFSENFGFEVEWDSNKYIATMIKGDKTICFKPDSSVITVNGSETKLDVPAKIIKDRLFVPLRNINEIAGKKVTYKKGIILVTDGEASIEKYSDKEFAEVYFNFIRTEVTSEHKVEAIQRWKAAYTLVNDILTYYNKSIPTIEFYFFPDHGTIPKEAYYHSGLAVYLNLLTVEKGDFEPFKSLTDEEINGALLKFKEMLLKEPELNFDNTKTPQKDLTEIVNNIIKNKTDIIRISIYDFATDTSVNFNGEEHFYAASLTKMVNLLCFMEEVKNGKFDLKKTYTLKESDKYVNGSKVTGTGNLQYQANGTKYTYKDILSRMISLSDNVGANIIFDALGRQKFEAFCQKYELNGTMIYKKFYDASKAFPSNYTTASDLTRMLVLLENRSIVNDSLSVQGIEFMKKTVDKNRIALYAPKDVTVANKIGTLTRLAGDMALVYFKDREPIAMTIVVEDKNRKAINEAKANELIGLLSKEIINYYSVDKNPSVYVNGSLLQKSAGLRFINNRPFIQWNNSLEGYSPESILIGSKNYISLDSLTKDKKHIYSLNKYPADSVCIK